MLEAEVRCGPLMFNLDSGGRDVGRMAGMETVLRVSRNRWLLLILLAAVGSVALAQSGSAPQANPFPEDGGATVGKYAAQATQPAGTQAPTSNGPRTAPPPADAAKPIASKAAQNPFPGEGSDAPILPVGPGDANAAPRHATDSPTVSDIDPDGDPVRTPEWDDPENNPATAAQEQEAAGGYSSSNAGMQDWNTPDPVRPTGGKRRHGRGSQQDDTPVVQTPEQQMKEDLNVGSFYLDQKNWIAAENRFADAFQMNPEQTDALWGLAVAEQHLQEFAKARQHYELFLSYGMDGRKAKEARKALKEMPQGSNQ